MLFLEPKPTIKFFLLYHKNEGKAELPVYGRIIYRSDKCEFSLKMSAKPSDWDEENQLFKTGKQYHLHNNQNLLQTIIRNNSSGHL